MISKTEENQSIFSVLCSVPAVVSPVVSPETKPFACREADHHGDATCDCLITYEDPLGSLKERTVPGEDDGITCDQWQDFLLLSSLLVIIKYYLQDNIGIVTITILCFLEPEVTTCGREGGAGQGGTVVQWFCTDDYQQEGSALEAASRLGPLCAEIVCSPRA